MSSVIQFVRRPQSRSAIYAIGVGATSNRNIAGTPTTNCDTQRMPRIAYEVPARAFGPDTPNYEIIILGTEGRIRRYRKVYCLTRAPALQRNPCSGFPRA